jgi:membrane protease subunit HflK
MLRSLPGSGGDGGGGDRPPQLDVSPARVAGMIALALLLIAVWSGIYTVPAEAVGVVLRFGKYQTTVEPGLRFKIPFGVDVVAVVPVRRQLKQEFGFGTAGASNPAQFDRREQEEEKSMVTGDLNTALVEWIIQYRIREPREFLFQVRNPSETLRDVSESVMREVVGDRTVDEVITIGRQEIESEAVTKMQDLVKKYGLGLSIDQVQLKNVNPPKAVQASFNEVNQAQQERERSINVAKGEYNKVVPRAKGQADQKIQEAEGYATERVNEALGDVARFDALFTAYAKAPDVTRRRIYLETMAEVLPALGRKVVIDEDATQILPLLQLDDRKAETE